MNIFLALILSSLIGNAHVTIKNCGPYEAKGVVRSDKSGVKIVVFEGTMSEVTLSVGIGSFARALSWKNQVIFVNGEVVKIKNSQNAVVEIEDIRPTILTNLRPAIEHSLKFGKPNKNQKNCRHSPKNSISQKN